MLELGVGVDLLRAVGWLLWGVLAMALLAALIKPKTATGKVLSVLLVLGIFFGPMLPGAYRGFEYKLSYSKAKALFDERCKAAGEKIYRTVDNVEGVALLKIRPQFENKFSSDQMYPGAAAIGESGGDDYISSFLQYDQSEPAYPHRRWRLTDMRTTEPGFKYVDVISGIDGKSYRHTAQFRNTDSLPITYSHELVKTFNSQALARYAVTFEDIVDARDRDYWIAGTKITVLDTQTHEVIAEQLRYLFDSGLGSTASDRSPWSWASYYVPGCPVGLANNGGTRFFVTQVLKPSKEK